MKTYLKSLGFHVHKSIKIAYVEPTTDITDPIELKMYETENKAKNALMSALTDAELTRVSGCESAKAIWDKLKGTYEGDDKIKEAKLQHFRAQFEGIRMQQDESVESFMMKVNKIVSNIRGLGEELKDPIIMKKILRSLPDQFNAKVSAIEEAKNLNELSLDELNASLIAYELRMPKSKAGDKQAAFKAMKKLQIEEEKEE